MQIRIFLLLSCLLAATLLKANPHNPLESGKHSLSSIEWGCNLPAPTNFVLDSWGPDWVHLKWDLTNPNYQHRINIYSCVDSSLVKTLVVDAGVTDITVFFYNSSLDFFYYEIKAICTSGDSPNAAWINCFGGTGTGIIHDLIVAGYTPATGNDNCTINSWPGSNDRCYFSNTGISTFEVRQTNNILNKKKFNIQRIIDPENYAPHFELDPLVFNSTHPGPGTYEFFVNYFPPNKTGGTEYEIMQNGRVVAVFVAGVDELTGESYLKRKNFTHGYEIVRISNYNSGGRPGGERDDFMASQTYPATASPNPFYEVLDVFPGNTSAAQIQLQMYNLSGQKVLDQQFPGGQEQYSLSTEGLSAGFYFLRIEADGAVQTLKVIKSE